MAALALLLGFPGRAATASPVASEPDAYRPTLWLDDAAAAIAAALRVPAGTYNVADTDPPTNAEIDGALAAAVGVEALRLRAPQDGPLARSQRVSSHRLRGRAAGAAHARGHGYLGPDRRMTPAEALRAGTPVAAAARMRAWPPSTSGARAAAEQ